MNTNKSLFTLFCLAVGITAITIVGWRVAGPLQSDPLNQPIRQIEAVATRDFSPAKVTGIRSIKPMGVKIKTQDAYVAQTSEANHVITSAEMRLALVRIEAMPDSPVKDQMLQDAIKQWARQNGAEAIRWTSERPERRRLIPGALREWGSVDGDHAKAAWALAKQALAADGDAATWLATDFVKTAFGSMAAVPTEEVWHELKELNGTTQLHAMMGMADFASNGQTNTAFSSDMESRTNDMGSASLTSAFYAAAGHITAAKEDYTLVTDAEERRVLAREIAKQQAVLEPSEAIAWLESQFDQPTVAIDDMVESIGLMQALNAGDVLEWLSKLPETEERTNAMVKIQENFPDLHANATVQTLIIPKP